MMSVLHTQRMLRTRHGGLETVGFAIDDAFKRLHLLIYNQLGQVAEGSGEIGRW